MPHSQRALQSSEVKPDNMKGYFVPILISIFPIAVNAQLRLGSFVDTRVGTAASTTRTAGMFGQGTEEYAHTLPAVLEPNGMNFWTPQTRLTENKGVCPYIYHDSLFQGIRCSHWIVGGCTQDYGSFTLLPTSHNPALADSTSLARFYSSLNHSAETATPSYYAITLSQQGIKAEVTSTCRSGIMRFTYDNPDSMFVIVQVNNDYQDATIGVALNEGGIIWGENPVHRIYQGWGEAAGQKANFVIEHNGEIERYGRIDRNTVWVKIKPQNRPLVVKTANSFVSSANARNNLFTEIPEWDFDIIRQNLEQIWEKRLGCVTVSGGTDDEKSKFYGAMYRASFLPHLINDVDGSYPKFADGSPVNDNSLVDFHVTLTQHNYYDDFSLWDTYRALHPLLTILHSQQDGEMMQSLVRKAEQGGWMPIFPCWNSYTAAMIGDHVTSVIADAYVKGVRNFDAVAAYKALRRNAFESPATYEEYCNGMGRRALRSYLNYGYIPLEDSVNEAFHKNEQTSRTLEYAYNDYALAQLARALYENRRLTDKEIDRKALRKDYATLMKRSLNYQNVFNPKTGWVGGRHADGTFAAESDTQYIKEPEKHPDTHTLTPVAFSTFITEGTPVHYSWYVPHDIKGMIKAMGGRKEFERRLDAMFADSAQLYWHGNEPCHQIAYLYSAIGRVDKCAKVVSRIKDTEYLNSPGGLSGNDDAGQMSAWYIFSALGFYPVCPSTTNYYLGMPSFDATVINLDNGKAFTVEAKGVSQGKRKIKSIKLNDVRLNKPIITHDDIMSGGKLEFIMAE